MANPYSALQRQFSREDYEKALRAQQQAQMEEDLRLAAEIAAEQGRELSPEQMGGGAWREGTSSSQHRSEKLE